MYCLKQTARLASNQLVKCLGDSGYKTRKTKFCLCVDDFGVKYYNKEDANHLLSSFKNNYNITVDWKGNNYCGLKLDWNYQK